MKYKYYKFELIEKNFKKEFSSSVKENNYKLIASEEYNDIKMEFYKKKLSERKLFIMYVTAKEIDEDSLDLIVNYYLKKNIIINCSYECYNIFIVLDVSDCKTSVCLSEFVKYGVLTPENNRYLRGINQLPLVYDRKENILYVGFYPNNDYYKKQACKLLFDCIYSYYDDYYRKYNLKINECIIEEQSTGKKFKEGLYPKKNIYSKYSDKKRTKEIFKKICIFIVFSIFIIMIGKNLLKDFIFLAILAILSIISEIKINSNKENYKSYNKIKLDGMSYLDVVNKLKQVLAKKKFNAIDDNVYNKKDETFYFIDEYNYNIINVKENSYLIIDSHETNKTLNLDKESLEEKNIVALIYEDNMLYVLNRKNENKLKELYKIIREIYFI